MLHVLLQLAAAVHGWRLHRTCSCLCTSTGHGSDGQVAEGAQIHPVHADDAEAIVESNGQQAGMAPPPVRSGHGDLRRNGSVLCLDLLPTTYYSTWLR